jgi:hypothetical protein
MQKYRVALEYLSSPTVEHGMETTLVFIQVGWLFFEPRANIRIYMNPRKIISHQLRIIRPRKTRHGGFGK